jgi:predicted RNase H-like nuclease (RuvC/YqgF family)
MTIVEIRQADERKSVAGCVLQSDQDRKHIEMQNRIANLNRRLQVATRSIDQLEKERSTLRRKFKF